LHGQGKEKSGDKVKSKDQNLSFAQCESLKKSTQRLKTCFSYCQNVPFAN
jgi:hypothetical protein